MVAEDVQSQISGSKLHDLGVEEFARLFATSPEAMPQECRQAISELDFRYETLQGREREAVLVRVLRSLEGDLEVAGRPRKGRWEDGWSDTVGEPTLSANQRTETSSPISCICNTGIQTGQTPDISCVINRERFDV